MMYDKIVSFLEKCYTEMRFIDSGYKFDPVSVIETIKGAQKSGGVFLIEASGEDITGIFATMIVKNIMDYSQDRAVEYIWHTDPELSPRKRKLLMEKLLSMGCRWAEERDMPLVVSTSASKKSVSKILIREGFTELETSHVRKV